ncbi:hypothetical protein PISL3812_08315 [Talaromyces islandicus]|uniref:Xylanolytic transcriptional activator regulatory domain-containing protein n=1 Tax=Talaromyces islandicus TaxID=28573 RepID=A0A0U1M6U4_TALIS|nr:hypothetical protein PISL3812_08315 [Talaromyces islandicus]
MPTNQHQAGEPRKQIVVAITGATGAILAINLLVALRCLHVETHLIMSKWAESTIKYETDYHPSNVRALADHVHNISDMAAPISSGSFRIDGMIILPCSETPCSLCKELQIECLYSEGGSLSNLTGDRRYILRLERRLDDIERTVEHLKSAQGVAPSVASESLPEGSTRNYPGLSVSELGQVDSTENSIDGMGAMYFTDEEDCGFFVQYLLILGQYLQGTQKSTQAWTTHSLAISAAYQLGIHSPSANLKYSPLEHEIRKRTWYGCVLLDRTLSMTFGRPCSIPQSFIHLDGPNKDVQMLSYNSEPIISAQLDGNFFTAAIQLYAILYNVLNFCYGQNLDFQNSPSTTDSISHILDGQRQLNKWRTELVPSLGLHVWEGLVTPEDVWQLTTGSVIHDRFNIVLSVRYNNLRILLHRPRLESCLEAFCHSSDISNEDRRIMLPLDFTSVQNCVESSTAIISMIHSITTSGAQYRRLLGAWNYSLYYTFNAALVLIGCLMTASKERKDSPLAWDMVDGSRVYIDKAI